MDSSPESAAFQPQQIFVSRISLAEEVIPSLWERETKRRIEADLALYRALFPENFVPRPLPTFWQRLCATVSGWWETLNTPIHVHLGACPCPDCEDYD